MRIKLSIILDECITRISEGESIEDCLARYPEIRDKLRPLLSTAQSIANLPDVKPPLQFRQVSRDHLLARIRSYEDGHQHSNNNLSVFALSATSSIWDRMSTIFAKVKVVAIPTMVTVLVVLLSLICGTDLLYVAPSIQTVEVDCTIKIIGGSIEYRYKEEGEWQLVDDGMVVPSGTWVRALQESQAVLQFLGGTTLKLSPDTEVKVVQANQKENAMTIIIAQHIGTTWSNVVKPTEMQLDYRVETLSANITAHGTLFLIEIDDTGLTVVKTIEGRVSVSAEGEEIALLPGQQTTILLDMPPSNSTTIPTSESEIIVEVEIPLTSYVTDPTGSTTGYSKDGNRYNEIALSQLVIYDEGKGEIRIVEPMDGQYSITVETDNGDLGNFKVKGITKKEIIFEYPRQLPMGNAKGWRVKLDLDVEEGTIINGTMTQIEPIEDEESEKKSKVKTDEPPGQDKKQEKDKQNNNKK
ncbi:FecR domain-containing protein [bacterium]|nr:FecR domain-containing protein [bacterium]